MNKIFLYVIVFWGECISGFSQEKGFLMKGCIPDMPDGVRVTLLTAEESGSAGKSSTTLAETTVKNGCFELRGKVEHPLLCTLVTNNQLLRAKDPSCPIKWTYTSVFVENVNMTVKADSYENVTPDVPFLVEGGEAQRDYTKYQQMLLAGKNVRAGHQNRGGAEWEFILSHPHSVVSVMFANQMLLRGYSLTKEQVETLEKTILSVPADTARFSLFKRRIASAKYTVVGAPLVNLEMNDIDGNLVNLVDIIPAGKFVLIDFWASWCGMCIHAMPKVKALQEEYKERLVVIAVSCDKKLKAWQDAMERINVPFPHYVMTQQGYDDFYVNKYQVRNGVPYYILVGPDGNVIKVLGGAEEVREILEKKK